jgi:hypothetical protein
MEEELEKLLSARTVAHPRNRWRCANELQLAAYVDGKLEPHARETVEAHLADCKVCLKQLSFLVQASDWPEPADVPSSLLARARSLVGNNRRRPLGFSWGWATAALATCLLLVGLLALVGRLRNSGPQPSNQAQSVAAQPEQVSPVVQPSVSPRNPDAVAYSSSAPPTKPPARKTDAAAPVTRNGNVDNHSPNLIFPRDGLAVKRASLTLRWQTVSDALFYEVSIMTESGDTIVSRQTEDGVVTLAKAPLNAGAKYFVSVRAHFPDGKTTRSRVVSFRVVE